MPSSAQRFILLAIVLVFLAVECTPESVSGQTGYGTDGGEQMNRSQKKKKRKKKKKKKKAMKRYEGLGMVQLKGGYFTMGGDAKSGSPGTKDVQLRSFSIDRTSVTNQMFRVFVRDTKYVTEAEKFRWSFVFDPLLSNETRNANPDTVQDANHWRAVMGAYWRRPEGPGSSLKGRWKHPAVHISKADAAAYCGHYGLRLPTEEEWEFAARGGMGLYPWGSDPNARDSHGKKKFMMNTFQGEFPNGDSGEDGWKGVAPVDEYEESAFGVFGMLGNVWEWTDSPFKSRNPKEQQFVLKGGSFVDSIDGKINHKVTATTRMGNTPDSGSINTGFRCAKGKGGGRHAPPNQEEMQRIIAEEGVEGLQSFLNSQGGGHQVMTAADLKKKQEDIQKLRAQHKTEL